MNTHEFRSQEYPIALVKVGEGRRAVDEAAVAEMVASIREVGLLNPITLNMDGTLIAGRHRLEAARRLGWASIPSVVRTLDDLHAELAEIDENLVNAPLTTLERGGQLKRRKAIYEDLHPEARHIREKGGPGRGNKTSADSALVLPDAESPQNSEMISSFTADTAAKTGRSERVIQEEVQIAERIAPEVKAMIHGTPLADQKTELLELARQTPEAQKQVVAPYAEAVKEHPFMAAPGWKPSQVLQAQEAIEALPVPEREAATSLVDKRLAPQSVITLLDNLKTKPAPEREEIYRLDKSDDPRERDMAITKTAATPPMPDPRIELLIDAGRKLREATKPFPHDPLTPRLEAVIAEVKAIRKSVEATSFKAAPVENMEAAS